MPRIMTLRDAAPRDASDPARDSRLPLRRATRTRCERTSPQLGRQALRIIATLWESQADGAVWSHSSVG